MKEPITKNDILLENIWLNKHIIIENKPFMWTNWLSKGIKILADVFDAEGMFLNQGALKSQYNITFYITFKKKKKIHYTNSRFYSHFHYISL